MIMNHYESWLQEVDRIVSETAGLSLFDLEDVPMRDWFEDRVRARTAARRALSRSGYRGRVAA
jgi:hypothetical protein